MVLKNKMMNSLMIIFVLLAVVGISYVLKEENNIKKNFKDPISKEAGFEKDTPVKEKDEKNTSEKVVEPEPTLKTSGEVSDVAYATPKKWNPSQFAQSLIGTDIDGGLKADRNGNLIIDKDIKVFFDYLFQAAPEVGGIAVIDKIKSLSESSLPDKAHASAMKILDDYLVYKEEVSMINQRKLTDENRLAILEGTLSEMEILQDSIFSPEVTDAFFGEEKAYAKYSIENMKIMTDKNLTENERNTLLKNNRMKLSEDVQAVIEDSEKERVRYNQIRSITQELKDPEQIKYALLDKGIPDEVASKIATKKRKEIMFNEKYKTYLNEIKKYENINVENYQKIKEELMNQHFETSEERTRARLKNLSN